MDDRAVQKCFAIFVGLCASLAVGIWLFSSYPFEITVQSMRWQSSLEIKQLVPVHKSGWESSVPSGARIWYSKTLKRPLLEASENDTPIMDTFVYYVVDEWQHQKTLTISGTTGRRRVAPVPLLGSSLYLEAIGKPLSVCEITATYQKGNETQADTWKLPCNRFDLLHEGQKIRVSNAGTIMLE